MVTFGDNIKRIEQAKADIKQAIEEKGIYVGDGLIDTYAERIAEIKEAGETQVKTVTITKNNSNTSIFPDDGYVGLEKVVVKTEIPMQGKDVSYNRNGYYSVYPEGKYDGMNYVGVNVNVPIQDAKDITIKSNGHYDVTPDSDNMGIAKVRIDVDVIPDASSVKIKIADYGVKFSDSNFEYVPEWVDFDGITDMSRMFYSCSKLKTIPPIDTTNVTNISNFSAWCPLTDSSTMADWNTSNVEDSSYVFYYCKQLISADISKWDLGKCKTINNMFDECTNLETISSIDARKLDGYIGASFCGYSGLPKLKNFGGWIGLKTSVTNYGIENCANLTYESCINVLNGLYDFVGNGTAPTSSQGKLKVHQNFLNLVGDEITIGTNKGWTITA